MIAIEGHETKSLIQGYLLNQLSGLALQPCALHSLLPRIFHRVQDYEEERAFGI
ncbi:hypothetical protein EMCG_00539 [[Emmonsia] crescens]|uniref:Uncharacterized protein n=1 Tax=[Emmonsia] crescens TaxID=73230 RepID=A0A0G2J838_9EURO|nr:hypothetical protein EMCG_00539 [Emmonsia crescens UAMH 3008]